MISVIYITLAIMILLFVLKFSYVVCTAFVLPKTGGALYVSTTKKRVAVALDHVPMTRNQVLFDLGCGDARVLRMAVRKYRVQAIGFELNWLAYIKAKILCFFYKGVTIKRKNFWKAEISTADVIFCYLYPDVMKRLGEKLKNSAKDGAYIVSFNFSLPGFTPETVIRPSGSLHSDPIFIYRNPVHGQS